MCSIQILSSILEKKYSSSNNIEKEQVDSKKANPLRVGVIEDLRLSWD